MIKNSIALSAIIFALYGCGDSDEESNLNNKQEEIVNQDETTLTGKADGEVAIGQFKDSNTSGLTFVSGDENGVTDKNGYFSYETGNSITFYVGGVKIGTSKGKSLITPIDLVTSGSSGDAEVQKIVSFLMMLDSDGDPSNGINISSTVQEVAKNWSQVDFKAIDLSSELTDIITDAKLADGGEHTLPDMSTALEHLEASFRCAYSGAFMGTYDGDDNGTFGFLMSADRGGVEGFSYSIPSDETMAINSEKSITFDNAVSFSSEAERYPVEFLGNFTSTDSVKGLWLNTDYDQNGNFSGKRIGGAVDAIYRFTGQYSGKDKGLFAYDVDLDNNITGVAYSVIDDELVTLTGSISGTDLRAIISNNTEIKAVTSLMAQGEYVEGFWIAEDGTTGRLYGKGCKLN